MRPRLEKVNPTGRLDVLALRVADALGQRHMPAHWPVVRPIAEAAIASKLSGLGLMWPWESEFWSHLATSIGDQLKYGAPPLFSSIETLTAAERAKYPAPPIGGYPTTPSNADYASSKTPEEAALKAQLRTQSDYTQVLRDFFAGIDTSDPAQTPSPSLAIGILALVAVAGVLSYGAVKRIIQ